MVLLCGELCETEAPERLKMVIVYLNRLSDYLFVLARYCNLIQGLPDALWNK